MCSDDPFNDGVSDLVVDRLVVGAADEELILEREDGQNGGGAVVKLKEPLHYL